MHVWNLKKYIDRYSFVNLRKCSNFNIERVLDRSSNNNNILCNSICFSTISYSSNYFLNNYHSNENGNTRIAYQRFVAFTFYLPTTHVGIAKTDEGAISARIFKSQALVCSFGASLYPCGIAKTDEGA